MRSPNPQHRPFLRCARSADALWFEPGRGKPIVAVKCDGLKQGSYSYEDMHSFLDALSANLDATNPGAKEILRQHGVDTAIAGKALKSYLHNPISIPFQVNWSNNLMQAAIVDIREAIEAAKPQPDTAARRHSVLVLNKFVVKCAAKRNSGCHDGKPHKPPRLARGASSGLQLALTSRPSSGRRQSNTHVLPGTSDTPPRSDGGASPPRSDGGA